VDEVWVINASPLIVYSRIDRLDLIAGQTDNIIVPEGVIEEIKQGTDKDSTAEGAISWAKRYQRENLRLPSSVEHWDIGFGESQVISHCLESGGRAVVDDRMARRCLDAHGLQVIGSLGIAIKARRNGVIEAARPVVYDLISAGLYLDKKLAEKALAIVDE